MALLSFFLFPFALFYGTAVKIISAGYRKKIFQSYRPSCPVISVGNVTWGGSGKTPLVQALAEYLKRRGRAPAILVRGCGRRDEAEMLKSRLPDIPVLTGRDRIKSAREAVGCFSAGVLILDDGFQHWRLRRDVDIVLIDARVAFGNDRLIPQGILREPLSALARADMLVLTKTDLPAENIGALRQELAKYNPQAQIFTATHQPCRLRNLTGGEELELSAIKGQALGQVCGIADPEYFTQTISRLGARVPLRLNFCDHYQYTKEDLQNIAEACAAKQIDKIITTEKDAAKLAKLLGPAGIQIEILVLSVRFKVKEEDQFFQRVEKTIGVPRAYSILLLSDGKAGHLNQSQAVAELIRAKKNKQDLKLLTVKSQIVEIKFRNLFFRYLLNVCALFSGAQCRGCLFCLKICLTKATYQDLIKTEAAVVVSAGSSLSSANRIFSYAQEAKSIVLLRPALLGPKRFDLVIVPEHDRIKPRPNILVTKIAPNLIERRYLAAQAAKLISRCQMPDTRFQTGAANIGVFIGGNTPAFRLSQELLDGVISQLKETAQNFHSQLLITTSRRTPRAIENLLKENFANFFGCKLLVIANERNIPEAVGGILGLSDIVLVSGESISMVSEAVSAEKYILAFIPDKKISAPTKQERFLENLEQREVLKIVHPDNIARQIEDIWKNKPAKKTISDRAAIVQALDRIL